MKLKVECVPGHGGDPEPHAFFLGTRRIEVVNIVDRWFGTGCRYCKLETADGARYILRFDEHRREWELTLFNAPGQSA